MWNIYNMVQKALTLRYLYIHSDSQLVNIFSTTDSVLKIHMNTLLASLCHMNTNFTKRHLKIEFRKNKCLITYKKVQEFMYGLSNSLTETELMHACARTNAHTHTHEHTHRHMRTIINANDLLF